MFAIGSDHGGFELKEALIAKFEEHSIPYIDCGAYDTNSIDYPDVASETCEKILRGEATKGILICGTGIGISIAANKIHGIRCAHVTESYSAKMAARHNDANVIALGGRTSGVELAWDIVSTFMNEEFEAGRHSRRVAKISALEKQQDKMENHDCTSNRKEADFS